MDLKFPHASVDAGMYESVYSVFAAPDGTRALWVRTTVRKRAGAAPVGALWVTWYDERGVRAAKLDEQPVAPGGLGISLGEATQGPAGSRGRIGLASLTAGWDVAFTANERPLRHLRPDVLYRAPMPRTKSTSPLPDLQVTGTLEVDGEPVDLTGWTGMLGHNWGSEHAPRWIWLRAAGFGDDGRGWLDAVLARVRVAGLLLPWTGFGWISLPDGTRHALGGLGNRRTTVTLHEDGADVTLAGSGLTVVTRARVDLPRTVGWRYADPAGGEHEVVNSSVARATVDVDGTSYDARTAVLEVGGDVRAFDVPLQDFPD